MIQPTAIKMVIIMKKIKKIISFFIAVMLIFSNIPAIVSVASSTDAMTGIKSDFSEYLIQTKNLSTDSYIGIPVDAYVFFNKENKAVSGYEGTPVILYVVNTNTERIGKGTDKEIITSMLDRGYIVTVLDYKNNALATGQEIEWSTQMLRALVWENNGFFENDYIPNGQYPDTHVVPAGYNVSLNNVFWETDKHAGDGVLEFLVNNWNTDFRGVKAEKAVKWVYQDGTRKPVENATDGTSPEWYSDSSLKTVDQENGQYTKIKYAVAKDVTDLANPDGTPVDLNNYINIIYPVDPENEVPVLCIAGSSNHISDSTHNIERPQFNGFLFRGYAGVVYDYAFVPMLRTNSWGNYTGSKSTYPTAVTGDSDNYGVHMYNNKRVTTAAMRYIRYLAKSQPQTFKLDTANIGVIGNSKGGAMSFLGEKVIQSPLVNKEDYTSTESWENAIDEKINSFISRRAHEGHHNETRYQNKKTSSYTLNGVTIDGGEKQPWLTFNGEEMISGAQLIYASNGVNEEDISEGHSPQIIMNHFNDPWHYYSVTSNIANICHSHNIPNLLLEVPLGHTFAYGPDMNYNIDTYEAMFDFMGYWLKNEPVKVIYTSPQDGGAGVSPDSKITVKFSGSVSKEQVEKNIEIKDSEGIRKSGIWKSSDGNTTWEFIPDVLLGKTKYTLTVSNSLVGENNVKMASDYTAEFYTLYDVNTLAESIQGEKGTYFCLSAPDYNENASGYKIRFKVTNDAANVVALYAVTNFNKENPDLSTVGELIGKVNLNGIGNYEINATEYILKNAGKDVAFILMSDKSEGESEIYKKEYSSGTVEGSAYTVHKFSTFTTGNAPDGTPAALVTRVNSGTEFAGNHIFYNNRGVNSLTVKNILGPNKLTEADYGRKFRISVKVYDTVSRWIQLKLNSNTSSSEEIVDYLNPMYNYTTTADKWTTYTFDYTVYDTDFGKIGFKNKNLILSVSHTGNLELPLYIGEIKVEEIVTGITAEKFSISSYNDGDLSYKQPESSLSCFALYDEDGEKISEHNTWDDALSAYKNGYTLKLMKNYTFTDDDLWGNFGSYSNASGENGHVFDIDLNGYTISSMNSKNSLFWLKNNSLTFNNTTVNVKNGGILLKDTPLVSYESSTISGTGKKFDLNLSDVNIGFIDNAMMDTVVSSNTIATGAETTVDINLNECKLNFPDDKHTPEYKTIFSAGIGDLNINYNITGGNLNLSSQRFINIQNSLRDVKYYKSKDGNYMTLSMPDCAVLVPDSCMLDGSSFSSYTKKASEDNITSYELLFNPLSTRYGVIPEEYKDADTYPIVWFDESGNFKGAGNVLYGKTAENSSSIMGLAKTYLKNNVYKDGSYGDSPKAAYIVLRKNYNMAKDEDYAYFAQVQGTVTVDLNGHTITQNVKPLANGEAKGWSGSGDAVIFPSEIVFENGNIILSDNSLVHFKAYDSTGTGTVKDKEFVFGYKNINFKFAEGATLNNLFTVGAHSTTKTAENYPSVEITDCKFDFEANVPSSGITLFGAQTDYIKPSYTITGSEIYADSMENITLYSSDESVYAEKNTDGEYLKIYVNEDNKDTLSSNLTLPTVGGDAKFIECESKDGYTVYTLENIAPLYANIVGVSVTKYDDYTNNDSYNTSAVDLELLTDGNITTGSTIDYKSASYVSTNGLDAALNASQGWTIELDKIYELTELKLIYSHTNKWVDFNVQTSLDNESWTDLGTIRPVLASENGDVVTIPLSGAAGKYIKITLIKRNGTSSTSTDATTWGPNLTTGGCSLALYELVSVKVENYVKKETAVINNAYVTKYEDYTDNNSYKTASFDKELLSDGDVSTGVQIDYKSASYVSTNGLDATLNKNQNWVIELDKVYKLDKITAVYSHTQRWVDFNIQVSTDNEIWTDLGEFHVDGASAKNNPVIIPLNNASGKYIKLTVLKRNATSTGASTTTSWVPNGGANFSFTLYEFSVTGFAAEFDYDNALSFHNEVYADVDTFVLENGETYTGLCGVVFARAVDFSSDYSRYEYGVILSKKNLTVEEMKVDSEAFWAEGRKISSGNAYGIRFYGLGIKEETTYYVLPYAKYKNSVGTEITVYGTKVLTFTPQSN